MNRDRVLELWKEFEDRKLNPTWELAIYALYKTIGFKDFLFDFVNFIEEKLKN